MYNKEKYYWLKLNQNFFKRHDIKVLTSMKFGDKYAIIFLKLLLESLGSGGSLRFNENLPYDYDMLSIITETDKTLLKNAMAALEKLGMLTILEDGTIYIPQIINMTGSETKGALKKRKQREESEENCIHKSERSVGNSENETDKNSGRGGFLKSEDDFSKSEDDFSKSEDDFSKSEGDFSKSEDDFSKSEGDFSKSEDDFSKSEDDFSKSEGDFSKSEGDFSKSENYSSSKMPIKPEHSEKAGGHLSVFCPIEQEQEQESEKEKDIDTDTETDKDAEQEQESGNLLCREKFPPDINEVKKYCRERGSAVDPERFFEYYRDRGWKTGGDNINDWRALLRYWERGKIPAANTGRSEEEEKYAF